MVQNDSEDPGTVSDPFIDPVRDRVPCDHGREDPTREPNLKKPAKPKRRNPGKRINAK